MKNSFLSYQCQLWSLKVIHSLKSDLLWFFDILMNWLKYIFKIQAVSNTYILKKKSGILRQYFKNAFFQFFCSMVSGRVSTNMRNLKRSHICVRKTVAYADMIRIKNDWFRPHYLHLPKVHRNSSRFYRCFWGGWFRKRYRLNKSEALVMNHLTFYY